MTVLEVTVVLLCLVVVSLGHGRLMDPPSRMSAWRVGFDVPTNYNDQGMNCGSSGTQWGQNGGKCGICGESWSAVKLYERPYGSMVQHNIITRQYEESSEIQVALDITANHKGWNEFRICDIAKSGGIEATQACLNKTLLADRSGKTRFDLSSNKTGFFYYSLRLPPGMTCSHCVLQWKWKTGLSWGCDDLGCGIGRGDAHEEFYGCSDVSIVPKGSSVSRAPTQTTSKLLMFMRTTAKSTVRPQG
ncbi:uncharacterized protein LOC106052195 isoform X2 [Biomphalaria glabrata]|uniref:Uncharacterized protein LOC106052195 isoform X1 n=1 Tax=Biomphalaria glabrata TaxID=6526 RepID=A0A9W2ZFP9_BIOGL|nr:uncharacterized protein LOC106052195 isoform X1 [Biomphalaria glabrata]XP_055873783.1 uncharacterized protein LOC106052195 isoform X2 [Biomphalaria glabrata]